MKIKASRNGEIILSFTDIGKSCPCVANMSFSTIRENKILAKISGLTVYDLYWLVHEIFGKLP